MTTDIDDAVRAELAVYGTIRAAIEADRKSRPSWEDGRDAARNIAFVVSSDIASLAGQATTSAQIASIQARHDVAVDIFNRIRALTPPAQGETTTEQWMPAGIPAMEDLKLTCDFGDVYAVVGAWVAKYKMYGSAVDELFKSLHAVPKSRDSWWAASWHEMRRLLRLWHTEYGNRGEETSLHTWDQRLKRANAATATLLAEVDKAPSPAAGASPTGVDLEAVCERALTIAQQVDDGDSHEKVQPVLRDLVAALRARPAQPSVKDRGEIKYVLHAAFPFDGKGVALAGEHNLVAAIESVLERSPIAEAMIKRFAASAATEGGGE